MHGENTRLRLGIFVHIIFEVVIAIEDFIMDVLAKMLFSLHSDYLEP